MSHTQSESSQEMKSETQQNADVHTHTHNTHTDVSISNNFYSICSEYEAHSERIKSYLSVPLYKRDRDGASSARPAGAGTLSWVTLDTTFKYRPVPHKHHSQQK